MRKALIVMAIGAVMLVTGCGTTPVDLMIVKTHTATFTPGTNGTYIITINDAGTASTTGTITVTDVLPAGLTYVSGVGTSWSCANSSQTVTCTNPGPISGGGTAPTLAITVAVASTVTGSLSNTATVASPGETTGSNSTSTDTMTVNPPPAPKIAITKSHSGNFTPGQNGVFTIAVSNTGNTFTTGATTVTDNLPTGLTFVSATGSNWTCTSAPPLVTCTDASSIGASGAAQNITLTVAVASNAPATVMNAAVAATAGSANATSTDTVTVAAVTVPDLAITKSSSGNFAAGTNGAFVIAVNNAGTGPTTGVISVTDTLNDNFRLVSGTGTGWSCSAASQVVTCTNPGPVASGTSAGNITLTVLISGTASGTISNTATVSDPGDTTDVADKSSTTSVIIGSGAVPASGTVQGGLQPVSGATIQLYAVGTTGDGSASTPLLTSAVRTNSSGQFSINGLYTCPAPGTLVYLAAMGGNPGLTPGTNNPNLALITALGPCGSLNSSTPIWVNELTTVASVFSLQLYMTDLVDVGSDSADAPALEKAFATVNEFVNTTDGTSPGPALPVGESASTPTLNLLANILATCVQSAGGVAGDGSTCGDLFTSATPPSGSAQAVRELTSDAPHAEASGAQPAPANAVGAAMNLAKNPANNVGAIVALASPTGPYQPALIAPPVTLTPTINFSSGSAAIQAQAVIPGNSGMLMIPLNQGQQQEVFAVEAGNSSVQDFPSITVSTSTGPSASLPVSITICQTNSTTGLCLAAPAATVAVSSFSSGATPAFSVFASASGAIAGDPIANRIYVLFTDQNGILQGSTSMAVATGTPVSPALTAGGIYEGTILITGGAQAGTTNNIVLIVGQNGQFSGVTAASLSAPVTSLFTGTATVHPTELNALGEPLFTSTNGNFIAAPTFILPDGGMTSALIFNGALAQDFSVTGSISTANNETGTVTASFNPTLYDRPVSLSQFNGNWNLRDSSGVTGTLVFDGAGNFAGTGTGANNNGCVYSGSVSQFNQRFNAFNMTMTISNCALAGTYAGTSAFFDFLNADDTVVTGLTSAGNTAAFASRFTRF